VTSPEEAMAEETPLVSPRAGAPVVQAVTQPDRLTSSSVTYVVSGAPGSPRPAADVAGVRPRLTPDLQCGDRRIAPPDDGNRLVLGNAIGSAPIFVHEQASRRLCE
jgi:hypothetical protein